MKSHLNPNIEDLKLLVREFPQEPGVYVMRNARQQILYVGKAKNLRARVRSYFNAEQGKSGKTWYLVQQIADIQYQITPTEVEAFLLEASFIKRHRPRYNIRLKDDRNYPYIKCDTRHAFPRFYLTRRVGRDGGLYFGPYISGQSVRDTLAFLQKHFRIRDCSDAFMKSRRRPCMTYQIGRCTAPCVDYVSREDYARDIEAALGLLRGEDKKVRSDLERKMKAASQQERYEAAAKYRDALKAVEQIWARQVVVSGDEKGDQDVFVFKGDGRGTLVESLHVRHGRLMGSRPHFLPRFDCNAEGEDPREWLVSFLNQYYSDNMVPDQILLGVDIGGDMKKLLGDVMLSRHGKRAQIVELMSGGDADLYEKALAMAEEHWKAQMSAEQKKLSGLEEIQRRFVLPELPRRIECFDISNFQGREAVASQVVFEDGRPRKEDYRRYKIRTAEGTPNDFMAMKEALSRRLRHTEYEDPQLIVVDGGKGQLNVAIQVLQELGRPDIPVVGLAKARTQGAFTQATVDASEERFFLPGRQNPLLFKPGSEAFQILVGVRDEAHRFALSYHRKLREAVSIASQLDEIPGLGEKRKSALLKKFSGPEAILSANIDEIASLRGFNRVLAERIKLHLEGAAGGASEQTSVGVDTVGTDNKS